MESQSPQQLLLHRLPGEILLKILSFIPEGERDSMALTCRQFYSLVCDHEKDKNPLVISFSDLIDPELMDSILSSGRLFNHLVINTRNCSLIDDFIFDKIEAVLTKFGDRVKVFKFWNSQQSKPSEINEKQLCSMLSHVPELEEFVFKNIYVKESEVDESDLDLKNLRKLELDYCLFDSPKVLNKIPRDVLRRLIFTFEPHDERQFQHFFNRQSTITHLELFENKDLNLQHLNLEHLKISSDCDFTLLVQQQPNLKYLDFAITWVTNETFEQVCKLQHLETFRTLIDLISIRVFKGLQELHNLRELRLDSHSSYDMGYLEELSLMRGMNLEKLTLLFSERKINSETVTQLAKNFHRLKHLEIINRSIKVLDTFVENFSNLETLLFDFFAIYGAPEDVLEIKVEKHENLKQLVVTNVNVNEEENSRNLLKLVKVCTNLERLMLSKLVNFTNEELEEIFSFHPNLTHLSLEVDDKMEFNEKTVELLLSAKKLKYFHLSEFHNCQFEYKSLKESFKHKFPIINLFQFATKDFEVIMKKRNAVDWHATFKLLMNHF